MLRSFRAALALIFLVVFAPNSAFSAGESLTVFAAASLKEVLEEVGKLYHAGGGAEVRFSFAASSALAKQIAAGAPADLFVSADLKWMDDLDARKLLRPETRVNLLGNVLVVVAPATSTLETIAFTPEAFDRALGAGKLATGEVNSVPVGIYAKTAFEKLGLWPTLGGRIAQSDSVRSALAFVARGEAPLGVVYATDARVEKAVKVLATFPAGSHEPVVYPVAITVASKQAEAAAFLAFLKGPAARAVFERAGFPVLVP